MLNIKLVLGEQNLNLLCKQSLSFIYCFTTALKNNTSFSISQIFMFSETIEDIWSANLFISDLKKVNVVDTDNNNRN